MSMPLLMKGQERAVHFDNNYIKQNKNKVSIEISEVQELTYIMIALTENGLKDSNMVNHHTEYYSNVINHFSPFRNHKIINTIDSLLKESIIYYILLSANAHGFYFDNDIIKSTDIYNFPAKGVGTLEIKQDPILTYLSDIQDFANKTGFKKFYKSNKKYFNNIKRDYKIYGAIDKQKKWLEAKFDYKIDSYRVLTSPLIRGINATTTFEDNSFKEMVLYLPIINNKQEWTKDYNQAMNSRVIFTEIDHNYVGPLSNQFLNKINAIFDKRTIWVNPENKSTAHYPSPIKVFDEYLTWGLFILYVYDTFPKDKLMLQQVIQHVNDKMKGKGFPKSKEFNEELLRLYVKNPKVKIQDIYEELLDWAASVK